LDINASVTSVTVNPASAATTPGTIVNFRLADRITGAPIVGFGAKAKCFPRGNTTTPVVGDCYPNLAFTLAKLVPGAGGTPSVWVNYIVVGAPVVTGGTTGPRALQAPSTENNGVLVDNGDGSYKYTFYNDITGVAALAAGITPPAGRNKADLGDLTYTASATHRLVIQIAGNAPGTGSNNSTGLATGFPAGVPLAKAVDAIYDFVPATGQAPAASANRKMVANANCESCHSTLGGLPGDSSDGQNGLQFHGGGRNNIEYCVICHTDQRRYGQTEATINTATRAFTSSTYVLDGRTIGSAPNFLHKIHVAGVMTKTNYNYANVLFDKGGYSQDIRNCDKCHDSTGKSTGGTPLPQAALWKTNSSRQACGSCHDGINFDTGQGLTLADKAAGKTVSTDFFGKAHPDNSTDGTCLNSSCHNAGAPGDPDLVHKPVTPPNTKSFLHVADGSGNNNTNSSWIASNTSRLPEGAIKVSYEIKSVARNATTGYPEMVFRMLQNGAAVDLNDPANPASINPATGQPEIWPNFMGAPSVYFVYSVPQDNVVKPVDFNVSVSLYLRCLWNGTAGAAACGTSGATSSAGSATPSTAPGSLVKITSGADTGYYKATINRVVPTTAVMLTGGLGYSYGLRTTFPLTQTNLAAYPVSNPLAAVGADPASTTTTQLYPTMPNKIGGLIVIAPNVQVVASGYTGRRQIVDDKRCNDCHQELGTFTEDAFHAGQRNDGSTCSWCHTPNRPSQGWSVDSTYFVHAIHAGAKRNAKFTYDATSFDNATQTGEGFFNIAYPGVLARCTQCHVAGSYDFTNAASANAAGIGTGGGDNEIDKRLFRTGAAGTYTGSPGTLAFFQLSPYITTGFNYGGNFSFNTATQVTTNAGAATLVMSPTVSVCSACHDSTLARSHMELNGGVFYRARSSTDVFGATAGNAAGTAVSQKVEQCFVCHASGRTAGITEVHKR
jgi:OmcA/MtrC family decaheme c-type cytochrome